MGLICDFRMNISKTLFAYSVVGVSITLNLVIITTTLIERSFQKVPPFYREYHSRIATIN